MLAERAGRGARRPPGGQFDDAVADELAGLERLTLLCGRYEGIDERVREHLADDALSIGPYVLSGGELAAMVVADAVLRKLPGALGDEQQRGRGVVLRGPRGRRRVPALHAPGRATAAGRCPRCCCPATTSRCAAGGCEQAAPAQLGGLTGRGLGRFR